MYRKHIAVLIVLVCLIVSPLWAAAQATIVKGRITDAANGKPLPFVTINFTSTNIGTNSDDNGNYELRSDDGHTQIQFSFIGYKTIRKNVVAGKETVLNIQLNSETRELNEVVVKPKKVKYRNKDNPAVELIKEVVAHREQNKPDFNNYIQYRQYEKMKFSLSNTAEKLRNNFLFRKYKFMTDNLDTTTLEGKALMPWYMQEMLSDVYYRRSPEKKKTYVLADKKVDFGEYVDIQGMSAYLKHMYQDVDIYKNSINVITNEFLSPIANLAPTFYRFYILDTTEHDGAKWVTLFFSPRNKADFLFQGKIYVTLDGNFAVARVDMELNKNINVNWIKSLHIIQDFDKMPNGRYYLADSRMMVDFALLKTAKGGVFGERDVSFHNYQINVPQPDSLYAGMDVEHLKEAENKTDSFWVTSRPDSLSTADAQTYVNIDKLKHSKSFNRTMDWITLFLAGYKKVTPYVEVGPVNTFYSFNPVEGFRARVGGRTTPHLSKRVYFETYAAYGFKDEKWKYYLGGMYSFSGGKTINEFPLTALKANFQRDTKIPGQELQFVQEDNFLLSFKRGVNDKWLYNDIYNVQFIKEFKNHFSYTVSYKNWKQSPAGGLEYIKSDAAGNTTNINSITTSEAGLELRWAPNEQFYQGKLYRVPIPNKYPVFTFRTNIGMKGVLGGEYNYQDFSLNIYKHVYLSQLGYSDVVLEGGYAAGTIPFPLLYIHHANQTYGFQLQSYNMMNFLEFVSDHYASLAIDHCFNGFFFNKIPVFRKLKFREFIDFKMLYGGMRNENNPNYNHDQLQFPTDENGKTTTFILGKEPYVEGSVGIGNILNFVRVDVVKRFTYLNNPNVPTVGIRARVNFDF
ncbi:DUF5686 and carboxypeptidase-like regulatory domain-containing protein [Taibaiella soli]|uniref:Carboxypeptidase-like regulatory domain-containing protein n=1 Tax=Taibaiella soli TaxID=1649169 RepID=A0A2W2BKC9_9BACT|nr:DUF5686 and carboxypeptidase-like regulatory domain-containing protein [Taibaiella soli]PZF73916.1 carboxypeptidase-like regulatory domain-containing protein [Taibaiella soli]